MRGMAHETGGVGKLSQAWAESGRRREISWIVFAERGTEVALEMQASPCVRDFGTEGSTYRWIAALQRCAPKLVRDSSRNSVKLDD